MVGGISRDARRTLSMKEAGARDTYVTFSMSL
jgi:hypothetical protein